MEASDSLVLFTAIFALTGSLAMNAIVLFSVYLLFELGYVEWLPKTIPLELRLK